MCVPPGQECSVRLASRIGRLPSAPIGNDRLREALVEMLFA